MVACISPSSGDVGETLTTLKYANRARNIKNQPIRNEHREELALQAQLDEVQRQVCVERAVFSVVMYPSSHHFSTPFVLCVSWCLPEAAPNGAGATTVAGEGKEGRCPWNASGGSSCPRGASGFVYRSCPLLTKISACYTNRCSCFDFLFDLLFCSLFVLSMVPASCHCQCVDRDAHIADLETKLGRLFALAKTSCATLKDHGARAARLCDDIRASIGPTDDGMAGQELAQANLPVVAHSTAEPGATDSPTQKFENGAKVPSGTVRMFGTAVLQRLEELSSEATRAAASTERSLKRGGSINASAAAGEHEQHLQPHPGTLGGEQDGVEGEGGRKPEAISTEVASIRARLKDAEADLARDEIIFASKNEEVLSLQTQVREQVMIANELQDEIDHLHWQLSQARQQQQERSQQHHQPRLQQQHLAQQPEQNQLGGWASGLFDDDDDGVLMEDDVLVGDDGRKLSTSPIEFDTTFTANAGRMLRQHFDGGSHRTAPMQSQPETQVDSVPFHMQPTRQNSRASPPVPVRGFDSDQGNGSVTPTRPPTSKGSSSSDEKRARQLQARIDEQSKEMALRQKQYEQDMQALRVEMNQQQDLIDTLTREEQEQSAVLEEHEAEIAQLEEDIDSYETELRRAAEELGRASETEKEYRRRQTEAVKNKRLLREAEAQLRKLRHQRQVASQAHSRSDGARSELKKVKQRQVALIRQFKADEAGRRMEAQRLKQQLAQLRNQKDKQELEITRLRESNKKQQSVIQQKDDLLRNYKNKQIARSPGPRRGGGGGGSNGGGLQSPMTSMSSASPSTNKRRGTPRRGGNSKQTAVAMAPVDEKVLDEFKDGVNAVVEQLHAQQTLDDRLAELRKTLGVQESKTAERNRIKELAAVRQRVLLSQSVNTLGKNLDALRHEVDQVAEEHATDIEDLDDEIDAISVDVAHIRQEIAAARHQMQTGSSFKALVEKIPEMSPATAAACLRWTARKIPELQVQASGKATELAHYEQEAEKREETMRKLQIKMAKQQADYTAQVGRLQEELKRIKAAQEDGEAAAPARRTQLGRSSLSAIRSRMGNIQHSTARESKLADETKMADLRKSKMDEDDVEKQSERGTIRNLRRLLKREQEQRQNDVRRMNRYRWEREKLRTQVTALKNTVQQQEEQLRENLNQIHELESKQVGTGKHGGGVTVHGEDEEDEDMEQALRAALDDKVFYKAQNKELKRKVRELGNSLARHTAGK